MGLLDDLQMGFGLKERTEDYDARTARTIAANEAAGGSNDAMRLAQARNPQHSSFLPVSRSRGAQQYLGSRGYAEGYTPQVAEDERPFMQRLLFSPESAPSPTRYAIGPLTMKQPIQVPKFGLLGMLSGLGGMLGGLGGEEETSTRSVVRPMLRPQGFAPYMPSGEPETTFTEDFSGVEMADFEKPMSVDALNTLVTSELQNVPDATVEPTVEQMLDELYEVTGDYNAALNTTDGIRKLYQKYVVDGVPFPYDRKKVPPLSADPTGVHRLPVTNLARVVVDDSNLKPYLPNDKLLSPAFGVGDTGYYDQQMNMGVGTDQLLTPPSVGMTLITTGPHAGKYMDANGRLVMP